MKYLRRYNESLSVKDLVDGVNDICLEFNDADFYSRDLHGVPHKVEIKTVAYFTTYNSAHISFTKHPQTKTFQFSEISDIIYRIKDFVGIDNIATFNYRCVGAPDGYTRCNMSKLDNETLDIKAPLTGGFIIFKFSVN